MALRESTHQADVDLFRQELVNLIDMRHELAVLAGKIDWAALEDRFSSLYAAGIGRPGHHHPFDGGAVIAQVFARCQRRADRCHLGREPLLAILLR